MNAGHAYFRLNGFRAGSSSVRVRTFALNLEDEQTRIATTSDPAAKTSGWHDMSDRRFSGKPATRGIYVKNGKKVIVVH